MPVKTFRLYSKSGELKMAKSATANKAADKNSPKPEPEVEAAKQAAADKASHEIITIKSGALSVDVGPRILAGMSKAYDEERKANELLTAVERKRFDMLADLTQAIVKAAKADTSIDLTATFSGDASKMTKLNNQLGLALGFREVTTEMLNGKEVKKIGYAKTVAKYFPTAKDEKGTEETQRKATIRSNFLHMLKKCAQASSAIVAQDISIKKDAATGTLQLTGPSITKQFGAESVLLNDKLTVKEGEKETKLKEKPSFTAIGRMGAAAAGKVLETRKDSRVASNAVDPDTAVQSLCNTIVQALGKLKAKPAAKTIEALNSVTSAIDKALKL